MLSTDFRSEGKPGKNAGCEMVSPYCRRLCEGNKGALGCPLLFVL